MAAPSVAARWVAWIYAEQLIADGDLPRTCHDLLERRGIGDVAADHAVCIPRLGRAIPVSGETPARWPQRYPVVPGSREDDQQRRRASSLPVGPGDGGRFGCRTDDSAGWTSYVSAADGRPRMANRIRDPVQPA